MIIVQVLPKQFGGSNNGNMPSGCRKEKNLGGMPGKTVEDVRADRCQTNAEKFWLLLWGLPALDLQIRRSERLNIHGQSSATRRLSNVVASKHHSLRRREFLDLVRTMEFLHKADKNRFIGKPTTIEARPGMNHWTLKD